MEPLSNVKRIWREIVSKEMRVGEDGRLGFLWCSGVLLRYLTPVAGADEGKRPTTTAVLRTALQHPFLAHSSTLHLDKLFLSHVP